MALPGQRTTTGFIPWDTFTKLLGQLQRDGEYKFCLLIAVGCFTGLRISDIRCLRWNQLIDKDVIDIDEQKTKKQRKIKINADLKVVIHNCYAKMNSPALSELVFINRYKSKAINIQWINAKLKLLFIYYGIKTTNPSTHLMRKTFGRRIWELNDYSEKSLVLLSEIFNHSSVQITKRYLGIKEEEIFDVYDQLSF